MASVTFNRVFSALDPEELEKGFVAFAAIGCQRAIAQQIVEKKADYILAVKQNQSHLLEEIQDLFRILSVDAIARRGGWRPRARRTMSRHRARTGKIDIRHTH